MTEIPHIAENCPYCLGKFRMPQTIDAGHAPLWRLALRNEAEARAIAFDRFRRREQRKAVAGFVLCLIAAAAGIAWVVL